MRYAPLFALFALAACKPSTDATAAGNAVHDVAVTDQGYDPARVEVSAGKPVTLRFTRKSAQTCGEVVLVDGDPVAHVLPKDVPVDVTVTPAKPGEIAFVCGMHMMRGVLVAK